MIPNSTNNKYVFIKSISKLKMISNTAWLCLNGIVYKCFIPSPHILYSSGQWKCLKWFYSFIRTDNNNKSWIENKKLSELTYTHLIPIHYVHSRLLWTRGWHSSLSFFLFKHSTVSLDRNPTTFPHHFPITQIYWWDFDENCICGVSVSRLFCGE